MRPRFDIEIKKRSEAAQHFRAGMKNACMSAVEMYIFYICAVVGGDGKAGFIGAQHIDIIYMDIHNVVGRFRTYLEKIAIGITNDIANLIIFCRAGKTQ